MVIFCRLVGDILTATAFLAYSGPFNQEYRALLAKQWNELILAYKIPHTKGLTVLSLLVESSEVRIFCNQSKLHYATRCLLT